MCYQSDFHLEAGLKTLVDIIVEMGYLPKTQYSATNRRIASQFRDGENGLTTILKSSLQHLQTFCDNLRVKCDVSLAHLEILLDLIEKCLSYDYNQVCMSESADDPTLLNIPASWKQYLTKEPHFL